MAEYFECLGCCAVTVVSVTSSQVINVTPPKCSKCGIGWGFIRSNFREAVEKINGAAAPNDRRALQMPARERRKNRMGERRGRG